jgi:hypothetical protein
MKKTMMYLTDELHRFLVREAADRGISMAEVAREAIGEYRARQLAVRPLGVDSLIGVVVDDDAATDLAERVDEVLAESVSADEAWERETDLDTR